MKAIYIVICLYTFEGVTTTGISSISSLSDKSDLYNLDKTYLITAKKHLCQ